MDFESGGDVTKVEKYIVEVTMPYYDSWSTSGIHDCLQCECDCNDKGRWEVKVTRI